MENNLEEASIRAYGHSKEASIDTDSSGVADMLEFRKFQAKADSDFNKLGVSKDKLALEREKESNRLKEVQFDRQLALQKLQLEREKYLQTAENVKILDKGTYKK